MIIFLYLFLWYVIGRFSIWWLYIIFDDFDKLKNTKISILTFLFSKIDNSNNDPETHSFEILFTILWPALLIACGIFSIVFYFNDNLLIFKKIFNPVIKTYNFFFGWLHKPIITISGDKTK